MVEALHQHIEVLRERWKVRVADSITPAFRDQIVQCGLSAVGGARQRNKMRRYDAIENCTLDVLGMTAYIDEGEKGAVRTAAEYEFWVAERGSDVIEIVDRIVRVIEVWVAPRRALHAAGGEGRVGPKLTEVGSGMGGRHE